MSSQRRPGERRGSDGVFPTDISEQTAAITGLADGSHDSVGGDGLADEAQETIDREITGDEARAYTREATGAIASLVRSTFGPVALEKLVETENPQGEPETVLSGDGNEILDAIERGGGFAHPVAAMFVDHVDSMQRELDDGTTAAILLAEALIDEGVDLVESGLHPGTVAVGYAAATNRAGQVLDELARPVPNTTESLAEVASTAMTATLPGDAADTYARLVAEAVERLRDEGDGEWLDADDVKVLSADADALVPGVVVRQKATGLEAIEAERGPNPEFDPEPTFDSPVEDAGIAIVDREIDPEETATPLGGDHIDDSGVALDSPRQVAQYHSDVKAELVERAGRLADTGVEILVSQPEQDDSVHAAFEQRGVRVLDDVSTPLSDVYRIARLADATVTSDLTNLSADDVGRVDSVTQRRVGDERWTAFERTDGPCSTLLLDSGADTSDHRHARLVEDALTVTSMAVMDDQLLPGACAPAAAVTADLRAYARTLGDREQLAVESFADSLERLPYALAENAGHDPVDALTALRAAHANADESPAPLGLDVKTGTPTDAWDAGVVAPRRVFSQAVETANAVAEHLLTVDTVLFSNVDWDEHPPRTEHD